MCPPHATSSRASNHSLRSILALLILLFGGVQALSCAESPDGELQTETDPFLWSHNSWNTNSWVDICTYVECDGQAQPDNAYVAASMYGKAVSVNIHTTAGSRCTGWLVDNEWMVTARHCTGNDTTVQATFGLYGDPTGVPGNLRGDEEARDRASKWLGLSTAMTTNILNLTQFTCNYSSSSFTQSEGWRDIHYYLCQPNLIEGIWVYPGDLFGHFNTVPQPLYDGQTIRLISANYRNQGVAGNNHVLIDDGRVYDAQDLCDQNYDNCFEATGDDQVAGSSGGPVLAAGSAAVGVVRGNAVRWPFYPPGATIWDPTDPRNRVLQDPDNGWYFSNRHSYLTDKVNSEYANTTPQFSPNSMDGYGLFYTPWAGGYGGSNSWRGCLPNFVAVGVIGTTSNSGQVGNFGLVCAPYNESSSFRELDRAHVTVAGSIGTGSAGVYDLNTYYNTRLEVEDDWVTGNDQPRQQSVRLCKPGYGLAGLRTRATSSRVTEVDLIRCRDLDGVFTDYNRYFSNEIGLGNTGTSVYQTCASGKAVTHMSINAGWETDGFLLACDAY